MISKSSGFIENEGLKIHYIIKNRNKTPVSLLFVPGIMMPAWIWDRQLDYFSKNYRVVAMDPRSQGDSDQTSEGHYAYSRAKDIQAVVNELQMEPLILIGWSLGVPEVINYAKYFGSKGLIGLALVDGLIGIDSTVPFYQETVDYWAQFQMDRIPKTREFIKKIFKQPQTEEYFQKLTEEALRTPTNTVMTLINNYILQDFRSFLPSIHIPTLIATTEGPRLSYMQKMQELIPHSRLEIFKSSGHALFVDQSEKFNHLLGEFIKDLHK